MFPSRQNLSNNFELLPISKYHRDQLNQRVVEPSSNRENHLLDFFSHFRCSTICNTIDIAQWFLSYKISKSGVTFGHSNDSARVISESQHQNTSNCVVTQGCSDEFTTSSQANGSRMGEMQAGNPYLIPLTTLNPTVTMCLALRITRFIITGRRTAFAWYNVSCK